MAETMPYEMDQSDSSSDSYVVEIASETPQQQKPIAKEPMPIGHTVREFCPPPATRPECPYDKKAPSAGFYNKGRPVSKTRAPDDRNIAPKVMPDNLHECAECVTRPFKACFPPAREEGIAPKVMPDDLHECVECVTRPFKARLPPAQEEMGDDDVIDITYDDERPSICISRVIHTMRDIKPDVYTPKFVSIGPFHHGNERLQDMERSKQVFFKRFGQRPGVELDSLNSFIETSLPEVRASYSENINLCDRGLVKLILVDAAFIIELFFCFGNDLVKEILTNDSKLSQLAILGSLPLDLVLFENQLPFFVLEKLFDIAFPNNVQTFPELACDFFSKAFDLGTSKLDHDNYVSVKHFTDLIRFLLLQRAPPTKMAPYLWDTPGLLYSAKELQEFGVNFKVSESKSILDIKFSGGVLELPQILVADPLTDALFHNTIAFEQLHCSLTSYITNYVTLWSDLINTVEDVHVLVGKNVIRSFIPDTEVVTLFRSMGRSGFQAVMIPEYIDIFKGLNKFCENRCRQNIASLRRDYCRTPWQCVASVAGIFLLVLTFLQTIFSIPQ